MIDVLKIKPIGEMPRGIIAASGVGHPRVTAILECLELQGVIEPCTFGKNGQSVAGWRLKTGWENLIGQGRDRRYRARQSRV